MTLAVDEVDSSALERALEPALLRPGSTGFDPASVTQQARNVAVALDDETVRPAFLIRDRDSKYSRSFDEVFRNEGIR